MHSILKRIFAICLIGACFNVVAQEANYAGVMYKYRDMQGANRVSYSMAKALPSFYNGGEIFIQRRFESDVGVYLGFEQSKNATVNHRFGASELFIGTPQSAGDLSTIATRIRAMQLDIVGYVNYLQTIEIVGQFGFSLLSADMHATLYTAGIGHNLAPSRGYKPVPRFGIGMHYFFIPHKFGLRIFGDWEGTNFFRMHMTDDDGIRSKIRPFESSWCISVGFVMKIME